MPHLKKSLLICSQEVTPFGSGFFDGETFKTLSTKREKAYMKDYNRIEKKS
jgi:hypothetical protein